jgi:hypothetical protein
MFLADQRLCPVSIGVARTRLTDVAAGGWLSQASAAAYRDGLDHLLWGGPPDDPSSLSRLTRTHFLDPVHQEDSTTMGMRWEATGPTGQPFAALDADITLTAEGDQHTRMTLTGVYRPPLDPAGTGTVAPGGYRNDRLPANSHMRRPAGYCPSARRRGSAKAMGDRTRNGHMTGGRVRPGKPLRWVIREPATGHRAAISSSRLCTLRYLPVGCQKSA